MRKPTIGRASKAFVYDYTITDINPNSRLVALRDQHGRHHLAHCTSDLPAVGECLSGAQPLRGFGLLIGTDGTVCRMTFSQIHCGAAWVRGHLQHDPGPGGTARPPLAALPDASAITRQ
jgi:hypothetical protein